VDSVHSRIDPAGDAAALARAQKVFSELLTAVVSVPNGTFASSSDVYITLTVNTPALNLRSTEQIVLNVISAAMPTLAISGSSSQALNVYSSVTLTASIVYPSCYISLASSLDYSAKLNWTA
jgi:hypothetical protein